jgi:hypothetical protein
MNQFEFPRQPALARDTTHWSRYVRKLLYQVQLDANPLLGVDRVLNRVVYADKLATPRDYLHAVNLALASEELLSNLLPHFHHEAVVRQFLAAVKRRLEIMQSCRSAS